GDEDDFLIRPPDHSGTPGDMSITGAEAATSGDGGPLFLRGGDGVTDGDGGAVTVAGGDAVGTDKAGGDLELKTGVCTGTGNADFTLSATEGGASGFTVRNPTAYIRSDVANQRLVADKQISIEETSKAQLTFVASSLPGSPSVGDIARLSTPPMLMVRGNGLWAPAEKTLYRNYTQEVLNFTAIGSQVFSNHQYTIPANSLEQGTVLEINGMGYVGPAAAPGNIDQFNVRLGNSSPGSLISALGPLASESNGTVGYNFGVYVVFYNLSGNLLDLRAYGYLFDNINQREDRVELTGTIDRTQTNTIFLQANNSVAAAVDVYQDATLVDVRVHS
ncbi:MAG: hypothetical protein GWN87_20405, partial [Desulfuromonadales bacterium]|nr:hypothetical protein [Desulfuromonadales bacterium]